MKHLDINGKEIQIGDVVVIHTNAHYLNWERWTGTKHGGLGVIRSWGCVIVEVTGGENRSTWSPCAIFEESDLETLGPL